MFPSPKHASNSSAPLHGHGRTLTAQLQSWQDYYNQHRPHGSLGGRTPWQIWYERTSLTPFRDEVEAKYDRSAERLRHPVYRIDQQLTEQRHRRAKSQPES
jgi:hypothetical protein